MHLLAAIAVLISSALPEGTSAAVTVVNVAHNTTVKLMCADTAGFLPTWFMNGLVVVGDDYSYSIDENSGVVTGTLMINGNHTCGTFNVYCSAHNGNLQNLHNTSLTVQGPLPSPEYVRINESISSVTIIEWNPPYSALNNETDFVYVDPHIIKYTVYIIDNYTGNSIDRVDVTETQYTISSNASDGDFCPMYVVTAWNSGGEGDMSLPLPRHTPKIPRHIATEDITVTEESEVLHVSLHVIDSCTVRLPNSFLVTLMTTAGVNLSVQHHNMYQSGLPVSIRIRLPQNDICNLTMRLSVGNSAGMSTTTEIAVSVGCQTTDYTGDLVTADITRATIMEHPQESSIQLIIVIMGVSGGIVCVTLSVIVTVVCLVLLCAKLKQGRKEKDEVEMHHNQAYETVTRMNHSSSETKVPTEPCPAYGVVGVFH